MRWLLFGLLASWICGVAPAHAISGDQGLSPKVKTKTGTGPASIDGRSPDQHKPSPKAPISIQRDISLEERAQSTQVASPAVETISSLAKGSSPLNPWFPERGSIGVRVKVSW